MPTLFRIVTRWTSVDSLDGASVRFDRVHYRLADDKRAARKAEHEHNRASGLIGDGWTYRIVRARAVPMTPATIARAA